MTMKPRKVKAKITRTVTEIAIVYLDRDGNIEEFDEILEELDADNLTVERIITVITAHD